MTLARLPSDGPLGAATAFWRSLVELEDCDIGELDGEPIIRRFWPGKTDEMRCLIGEVTKILKTKEWVPIPKCVIRWPARVEPRLDLYGKVIELTWEDSPTLECPRFCGWVSRMMTQNGNKWPHMQIQTVGVDGRRCPDIHVEFPRFKA